MELTVRACGTLTAFAEAFEFEDQRETQALETVFCALRIGDAIATQPGLKTEYFYVSFIEPTLDCLQQHAHRISKAHPSARTEVRRAAGELIHKLLDGGSARQAFAKTKVADRAWIVHQWEADTIPRYTGIKFAKATTVAALLGFLTKPARIADAKCALQMNTMAVELTRAPRFPRRYAVLDNRTLLLQSYHLLSRPVSRRVEDDTIMCFRRLHTILAKRRLAAIVIAIRLYEMDHGRLPNLLETLVPGYLERLPEDSFAGEGEAFIYAPDRAEPVVYSVGVNGVDDGGDPRLLCPEWRPECDIAFYLKGDPTYRSQDDGSPETVEKGGTAEREDRKHQQQHESE